jgi:antitoxin (DNA-binding transcriptional repressor) of toxin-antitoxin stability system
MVARTIDVAEAQQRPADFIAEAQQGAEVIITSDDQPIARLVALPGLRRRPTFGSARGLISMSHDFDEPLTLDPPRRKAGSAEGMITMFDDFDEPLDGDGRYTGS